MASSDKKSVSSNKRLVWFLAFLVIALPVLVGILVWKLLPGCDKADDNVGGKHDANQGGTTFPTGTTVSRKQMESTTPAFEDGPWKTLRLPDNVRPVHYDVTLYPDFYEERHIFYGNISIELNIVSETNIILIHALYLNISDTRLKVTKTSRNIQIKRTFEYGPNEFWVVETMQPLSANSNVHLEMSFSGDLSRSIVGFYKSKYFNSLTNKNRFMFY